MGKRLQACMRMGPGGTSSFGTMQGHGRSAASSRQIACGKEKVVAGGPNLVSGGLGSIRQGHPSHFMGQTFDCLVNLYQ